MQGLAKSGGVLRTLPNLLRLELTVNLKHKQVQQFDFIVQLVKLGLKVTVVCVGSTKAPDSWLFASEL